MLFVNIQSPAGRERGNGDARNRRRQPSKRNDWVQDRIYPTRGLTVSDIGGSALQNFGSMGDKMRLHGRFVHGVDV
jgi:hypothetical protein